MHKSLLTSGWDVRGSAFHMHSCISNSHMNHRNAYLLQTHRIAYLLCLVALQLALKWKSRKWFQFGHNFFPRLKLSLGTSLMTQKSGRFLGNCCNGLGSAIFYLSTWNYDINNKWFTNALNQWTGRLGIYLFSLETILLSELRQPYFLFCIMLY